MCSLCCQPHHSHKYLLQTLHVFECTYELLRTIAERVDVAGSLSSSHTSRISISYASCTLLSVRTIRRSRNEHGALSAFDADHILEDPFEDRIDKAILRALHKPIMSRRFNGEAGEVVARVAHEAPHLIESESGDRVALFRVCIEPIRGICAEVLAVA